MMRLILLLGGLAILATGSLLLPFDAATAANGLLMMALWGFVGAFLWILWVRADRRPARYGLDNPYMAPGPAPVPKVQIISYRGDEPATVLWGELLLQADRGA